MLVYPKCKRCGRTMRRTTLARALQWLPEAPDELLSRDRLVPTFLCPWDHMIAVLHC